MAREYSRPFHVVCEGRGDRAFLERLIEANGLPAADVSFPTKNGNEEGVSGYPEHLKALRVQVDRGVISRIVVCADNDDDPKGSFKRIRRYIKAAAKLPNPVEPLRLRTGNPGMAIAMFPGTGKVGNLESLLLESARRVRPDLAACADGFAACCAWTAAWRQGVRDKMVLRAMIAGAVSDDPNCSLAYVWNKAGCPMEINDPAFTWLVDKLREFFT